MAQAYRDENSVPTLIASSSSDGKTPIRVYADPITHRLLVDTGGSGTTVFVYNEVVSGSGTSWTLGTAPTANTQAIYANGQRLTPTVDYSITGANITTVSSWSMGTILADYQHA